VSAVTYLAQAQLSNVSQTQSRVECTLKMPPFSPAQEAVGRGPPRSSTATRGGVLLSTVFWTVKRSARTLGKGREHTSWEDSSLLLAFFDTESRPFRYAASGRQVEGTLEVGSQSVLVLRSGGTYVSTGLSHRALPQPPLRTPLPSLHISVSL